MVVSLTTTKFKPPIFSVSGFTLTYAANMFISMILNDFCLLPAQFCYIIIYIWEFESHVQIVDQCAPWKICEEPCYVVSAILIGRCVLLVPRQDKQKSLLI
jgi:hypothetical protein